jgi:sugar phosphate isomerase/epimerase
MIDMKYGCCIGAREADKLKTLRAIGYDYAELPVSGVMELDDAEFDKLMNDKESAGLPIPVLNVFLPGRLRLTGDNADMETAFAYVVEAIKRVNFIGAKLIVLGSAGARNVPEGFAPNKANDQLLDFVIKSGRLFAEAGLQLAIEPLNKGESNIINTVTESYNLAMLSGQPNVGCLADFFHMATDGEDMSGIMLAGKRLLHAHFAEPNGRIYPPAPSEQYAPFFDALREIGYLQNGRVSIEASYSDFEKDAEAALNVLKSYDYQISATG